MSAVFLATTAALVTMYFRIVIHALSANDFPHRSLLAVLTCVLDRHMYPLLCARSFTDNFHFQYYIYSPCSRRHCNTSRSHHLVRSDPYFGVYDRHFDLYYGFEL